MTLRREDVEASLKGRTIEQKLIDLMATLSRNLTNLFKTLQNTINNINKLSVGNLKGVINTCEKSKDDIEAIKNEILFQISRASPALLGREDWLRLLFKLTNISDKILGVLYRIEQLYLHQWRVPNDIERQLIRLSNNVLKMLNICEKAITLTGINAEKAVEACREVESLERETDEIYRRLNFLIIGSNLSCQEILLLKDIAEMLEEISDTIESSIDDLRVILINLL